MLPEEELQTQNPLNPDPGASKLDFKGPPLFLLGEDRIYFNKIQG